MGQPPTVYVLDTSAIIRVKEICPPDRQQDVFNHLTQMAQVGLITYPRLVVEDLKRYAEKDLPFFWANANYSSLTCTAPTDCYLRRVMQVAGEVVDPYKNREDSDPYVLALALYLQDQGYQVVVVTNDVRDKSTCISMTTACNLLGLSHQRMEDFLKNHGLYP